MNPLLPALAMCAVLLAGCASSSPTPPANPQDAAAKRFQPPPGKASLYLSREGDVAGNATTLQIVLDGRVAGLLPPAAYQWLTVEPGQHVLMLNVASGEQQNLTPAHFKNNSQVEVSAEPGHNYFFRATLHLGWGQNSLNLLPVASDEGRKDIKASALAADQ